MKLIFARSIILAVIVFGAAPAWATHGTALLVDTIDGSGPLGVSGTLANLADSADWYSFAADAGDAVTISMMSGAFDSYLHLYLAPTLPVAGDARASYTLIDEDDDGGGFPNSLISIPSLPFSGNYVIAAESFSGAGDPLGSYDLTVSGDIRAVVPEPGCIVLASMGVAFAVAAYSGRRR